MAMGVHEWVKYQIRGHRGRSRPCARPPKYRPYSTGGRNFDVIQSAQNRTYSDELLLVTHLKIFSILRITQGLVIKIHHFHHKRGKVLCYF